MVRLDFAAARSAEKFDVGEIEASALYIVVVNCNAETLFGVADVPMFTVVVDVLTMSEKWIVAWEALRPSRVGSTVMAASAVLTAVTKPVASRPVCAST